ncbi:MAG: hypothetical protein PHG96_14245 [Kiritimatiellae bacterium]|nr:hypothetical protein [Kiritimatiellia bacterium]
MRIQLVDLFNICCMLAVGSVSAAIGTGDAPTNNYASSKSAMVIPDGRTVSGEFIVGKPTEIERLFDSTTTAYDGGSMSNAVCDAAEAIKRYEASKSVTAEKIGFTTPSLKLQMSYLYRIQAEALFSRNETAKAMGYMRTAMALDPDSVTNHVVHMCLATDLDDYPTQNATHKAFLDSSYQDKLTFYNELVKRGWFLPLDLTNEKFIHLDKMALHENLWVYSGGIGRSPSV